MPTLEKDCKPVAMLEGVELDYLVAKAMGITQWRYGPELLTIAEALESEVYSPSTNWEQGGPLIQQGLITVGPSAVKETPWMATAKTGSFFVSRGATPLIAAMKAFVVLKIGENVPCDKDGKAI